MSIPSNSLATSSTPQLRPYQQEAVKRVVGHFRASSEPALVVLPTGSGKSLVIAELARLARGRVLVLAHVRELVEQNHAKYQAYGLEADIFSAGLKRKRRVAKWCLARCSRWCVTWRVLTTLILP
ncbi:hypothetical protein HORIV_55330 [Vreelandella olivaria]|uniref:Helicase/UvrB N-terminal domain-containing protein n=1 Tax=Vreelandella olivaria TaxID=390919 RepID=A0ABM7GQZ8_9GAMM|nr:hypothetical protein HORIV_55330 [Halomonas olivaria]